MAARPGGKGNRRLKTRGINLGSYVHITYRITDRTGSEILEYEGKLVDKRVGWVDRESYVELKNCKQVNEKGQVLAREEKKRFYDAFIEDCKVTEEKEEPPEEADGGCGGMFPMMMGMGGMGMMPGMGMGMGMPGMGMGMGMGMMPGMAMPVMPGMNPSAGAASSTATPDESATSAGCGDSSGSNSPGGGSAGSGGMMMGMMRPMPMQGMMPGMAMPGMGMMPMGMPMPGMMMPGMMPMMMPMMGGAAAGAVQDGQRRSRSRSRSPRRV